MVKISVIMANYNGEKFLKECIDSVLNQSFSDFEFLILDAGSTDSSRSIVKNYHDDRIRLFHGQNIGLGKNLNKLIDASSAPLIARMDADDVMMPDRLHRQFNFMAENKDCVLSGTQIVYYNGVHVLQRTPFPTNDTNIQADLRRVVFSLCHPSIIFRRNVAQSIGGYHVDGFGEDLDFMLRMGQEGKLMNIDTIGLKYRYSLGSASATKRSLINCTYAYTLEKFSNKTTLEFEQFYNEWRKRSKIRVYSEAIVYLSDALYGKYILNYGHNPVKSGFYLICSAICKPLAVWRHLVRRVRNNLGV